MTNLVLLTDDEVKEIQYDYFNLTDLKAIKAMATSPYPRYTVAMGQTIYLWEQFLLAEARKLTNQYNSGYWLTENGFWVLQSNEKFNVSTQWGNDYELNALEFSIVANLFALSILSIATLQTNPAVNRRAVFFSDYIKEVMNKNTRDLNTSAIYSIID